MISDLRSLNNIISSSIDNIIRICECAGKDFPSLNNPIHHSEFSQTSIRNDPSVSESIRLIVAAATQLIATVQFPPLTLTTQVTRYTITAALGVAEAGHVSEILRETDQKGMHIDDIAAISGMAPKKLSRVLRYLATNHWFREVSPDVFVNNLLSSLLDSGKKIDKGFDVSKKYENSLGFGAYVAFGADECLKAASYLVETFTDPKTKYSEEPNCAAVQKALGIDVPLWDYYDSPKGEIRRKTFAIAMASAAKRQPPESMLAGYDWNSVPEGGIIVDVGGGLGQVSLEIMKSNPNVRVVVEDRPLVVEQAKQFWKTNLPGAISANKVIFIGTDFFEAQPELPGPPAIYLLRMIIHDWSDIYAIRLLRRLCDAADVFTKLIIIDTLLDYACGSGNETLPEPLLPNMGGTNLAPYSVDIQVFGLVNAGERTKSGFVDILCASGWKLQEIRRNPINPMRWASIIAIPG